MPPRVKSGPNKGRFRKVKRNPSKKKTKSKRRKTRARTAKRGLRLRPGPSKKRRTYKLKRRVRKSRKGKRFYGYTVSKNPKTAIKNGLMLYGGLLGMRVVNNLLNEHVIKKHLAASIPASVIGIVPAAAGFGVACFLLPKVLKGKADLVKNLQLGSVIALADAVVNTFIKPKLPASVQSLMGYGAYQLTEPLAEYLPYDNRLGEYLPYDNRLGQFDATEPLSADELAYMQTGGAGGVFSKTVFNGVG
jgi:hypothetical protein